MLIDGLSESKDIVESAGDSAEAKLLIISGKPQRIKWEIYKEDWYQPEYRYNQKRLKPLQTHYQTGAKLGLKFKVPLAEGPYRLFATAYDTTGRISTCNTPFYVVKN